MKANGIPVGQVFKFRDRYIYAINRAILMAEQLTLLPSKSKLGICQFFKSFTTMMFRTAFTFYYDSWIFLRQYVSIPLPRYVFLTTTRKINRSAISEQVCWDEPRILHPSLLTHRCYQILFKMLTGQNNGIEIKLELANKYLYKFGFELKFVRDAHSKHRELVIDYKLIVDPSILYLKFDTDISTLSEADIYGFRRRIDLTNLSRHDELNCFRSENGDRFQQYLELLRSVLRSIICEIEDRKFDQ